MLRTVPVPGLSQAFAILQTEAVYKNDKLLSIHNDENNIRSTKENLAEPKLLTSWLALALLSLPLGQHILASEWLGQGDSTLVKL